MTKFLRNQFCFDQDSHLIYVDYITVCGIVTPGHNLSAIISKCYLIVFLSTV